MRLLSRQVPKDFNLFLFGDVHLGTLLFAREAFDKFLDTVRSTYDGIPARHNYLIDHGDAIEAIAIDDKRYDARLTTDPRGTPFEQARDYIAMLRPLARQIIVRLKGNHELTLDRFGDLARYISEELDVPFGTYTTRVTYTNQHGSAYFKSFHTHGRKSINSVADDPKRRLANMELILKRHLRHKAGDCVLSCKGHTHKLLVCRPQAELYLTDDGTEIKQQYTMSESGPGYIHPDHRWYVNTGSFLRLYHDGESGYGETYEYDPQELGYAVALVRGGMVTDVRRIVG